MFIMWVKKKGKYPDFKKKTCAFQWERGVKGTSNKARFVDFDFLFVYLFVFVMPIHMQGGVFVDRYLYIIAF